ncbi:hypothetical protein C7I85_23940 [Mesorhizobium soli]|uniref:Uncharacterized protein n=1 Tax=Pseudaminobacter soli (ex Li et al. 2025) TaxID=1295366 RepID=A0A2P7S2J0_9HYPH|nr:hypothetical protein C7I85_23940 [Mesorhizobium soli]
MVTTKDGQVFANSPVVAEFFGKNHRDVIRSIDELIEQGVRSFAQAPYLHPQNGQAYGAFDMTRDGFTLLAMGRCSHGCHDRGCTGVAETLISCNSPTVSVGTSLAARINSEMKAAGVAAPPFSPT